MSKHERFLQWFLRTIGGSSLTAAFFVFVPDAWMATIHQLLGLGDLPESPIVSYLARSTSAFYALFGGLLWVVSFDLRRHRVVLRYLGVVIILFGLALFGIDWQVGLPIWWRFWEGPIVCVFGVVISWLTSRIDGRGSH
jgi:hypothetical protein